MRWPRLHVESKGRLLREDEQVHESSESETVRIPLRTAAALWPTALPSFLGRRKCSKSFSFPQLLENRLKVGSCNQVLSLGEPDEECDQDICCQGWPRDKGKARGCRENKNHKSSQTSWVPLVLGWGRGKDKAVSAFASAPLRLRNHAVTHPAWLLRFAGTLVRAWGPRWHICHSSFLESAPWNHRPPWNLLSTHSVIRSYPFVHINIQFTKSFRIVHPSPFTERQPGESTVWEPADLAVNSGVTCLSPGSLWPSRELGMEKRS